MEVFTVDFIDLVIALIPCIYDQIHGAKPIFLHVTKLNYTLIEAVLGYKEVRRLCVVGSNDTHSVTLHQDPKPQDRFEFQI